MRLIKDFLNSGLTVEFTPVSGSVQPPSCTSSASWSRMRTLATACSTLTTSMCCLWLILMGNQPPSLLGVLNVISLFKVGCSRVIDT